MLDMMIDLWTTSGFSQLTLGHIVMIVIACTLLYLGLEKGMEPYLMIPIAFSMLLVNLPGVDLMVPPTDSSPGGLFYYLYQGVQFVIFPPLIFLCIGVNIDFGPLIANPKTLLLGGAAQFGIFAAFLLAVAFNFTGPEAASIGIIGGADGPTTVFLAGQLAPHLLSQIALAAYSYMALVPVIQPPIIKLLTTKKERQIKMEQLREVSKKEKILYPIIVSIIVILLVPTSATLLGTLMLGNLLKESGKVPLIVNALKDSLMYTLTIAIGLAIGATASAELFLTIEVIKIVTLGLVAFAIGTGAGVIGGKLLCKLTGGKINPIIGAAGVSAMPFAARVVQKIGQEENPNNFLLMHAMGPNVSGIIASAIAAGLFIQYFAS